MSDLAVLMILQEHDSKIDRLRYRSHHLEERTRLAAIEEELTHTLSSLAQLTEDRDVALGRQRAAEEEANVLSARIDGLAKQMYAGTVTAAKDLQAMAGEVESLTQRRGAIEEKILEAMMEIESLDLGVTSIEEKREEMEAGAETFYVAIADAENSINAEIGVELNAREEVAKTVPSELLDRYESLRRSLDGVGIARLANGRCDGCHLALPSAALDRIRHAADEAVTLCDECGRILFLC